MVADARVLVRCRISKGGFPSERVFRVTLSDGTEHIGAAPCDYFFTKNKRPLRQDQPEKKGERIPGFLAARIISQQPDNTYLVSVPSGEVLRVSQDETVDTPWEDPTRVSVEP